MKWSREEVLALGKMLGVLLAICSFLLLGLERVIVLGMAAMWAIAVCAISLYFRQDYSGKNLSRMELIRAEFGGKYSFSFLFGQLFIRATHSEPSEDDALKMAKVLWFEGSGFRTNIGQYAIPVSGSDGKRRFYIMRATAQDGSDCIFTAVPVGSWWSPTFEPTKLISSSTATQ